MGYNADISNIADGDLGLASVANRPHDKLLENTDFLKAILDALGTDGVLSATSIDLGGTTLFASRSLTVDTGGVFDINLGTASGDDFTINTTDFIVEGPTGNVGVGIIPTSKFHVDGSITVAGSTNNFYRAVNSGNPEINLGAAVTNDLAIQAVYDGGTQVLDVVTFATTSSSATADKGEIRFNIDGNSNVLVIRDAGISVTALDISGSITVAGSTNNFYRAVNSGNPGINLGAAVTNDLAIQAVYDGGTQVLDVVTFATTSSSATADKGKIRFDIDGNSNVLVIRDAGISVTGNVTISGLTASSDVQTDGAKLLVSVSDERFKNIIMESNGIARKSIANATATLLQITPIYSRYKSDVAKGIDAIQLGFSAQNLRPLIREAAPHDTSDILNAEEEIIGKKDVYGFNSRPILAHLVQGFKETDARLKLLEAA